MSKTWIEGSNRLTSIVEKDVAEDIIDMGYIRILSEILPDGNVILSTLDENGKITGIF